MLPVGYRLAKLEDLHALGLEKDRFEVMLSKAQGENKEYVDIPDMPGAKGTGPWKQAHMSGQSVLRIPLGLVEDYLEALTQVKQVLDIGTNEL